MAAEEETATLLHPWSSESEPDEDERREYHQKCTIEGDGWSHGFHTSCCPNPVPNCDSAGGDEQIVIIHEPQHDVVRHFSIVNWVKLGDFIGRSVYLQYLDLRECELTARGITAIFGAHRSYHNCPLEKIVLQGNNFGPGGVTALLPFLRTRSKLTHLNLNGTNLKNEGARILAEALNHTRVEYLHIRDNEIEGEGLGHLLSADMAKHIVELSLVENDIGTAGYIVISQFLQRDDTDLKKIMINCDDMEYGKIIISSISSQSNLQDLLLWNSGLANDTAIAALSTLQKLLCNTSSVESLCQSNHNMKWLGFNTDAILQNNSTVKMALDINARSRFGASILKIVRCKLRTFYFRGEYAVNSFAKMNVKLMPRVLELVTRTEVCVGKGEGFLGFGSGTYREESSNDLGAVYRLVRNCHLPELYSYCSSSSGGRKQVDSKMNRPKVDIAQRNAGEGKQLVENRTLHAKSPHYLPNKRPFSKMEFIE